MTRLRTRITAALTPSAPPVSFTRATSRAPRLASHGFAWLRTASLAGAIALLGLPAVVACGPEEPQVVKANVVAGSMPAEGNWRGVFYSQQFGYLHLIKDGNAVSGKWRTTAGDKWGEMHGTSDGDVLRFEWEETRIGMFGPNAKSKGKGYFKYVVPEGDADHEIHGQWGLGENEGGYPWDAVKQRRMEPDPNSVMPDEAETATEGGDWDGNKSKNAAGAPEEKKKEGSSDPAEGWE
jgi:hypothetical protein